MNDKISTSSPTHKTSTLLVVKEKPVDTKDNNKTDSLYIQNIEDQITELKPVANASAKTKRHMMAKTSRRSINIPDARRTSTLNQPEKGASLRSSSSSSNEETPVSNDQKFKTQPSDDDQDDACVNNRAVVKRPPTLSKTTSQVAQKPPDKKFKVPVIKLNEFVSSGKYIDDNEGGTTGGLNDFIVNSTSNDLDEKILSDGMLNIDSATVGYSKDYSSDENEGQVASDQTRINNCSMYLQVSPSFLFSSSILGNFRLRCLLPSNLNVQD
jgi:hypothetical protein